LGEKVVRVGDMAGATKPKMVFDWRAEAAEHAPGSAFKVTQTVASQMFKPIPGSTTGAKSEKRRTYKVTVVGVGNVGMACAQTILTQDLCDELALVDVVEDKLKGEMLDLQHAAAFLPRARILADTDYKVTANSDICIVTAGARQREGESRLALVEKNVALFKKIIPQLVQHSPNTTLLVISNPVDALTYVAYKLAGLPPNRVIGSGTNLDSSRFRWLLADRLDINAQNVHGYIVGEHGDSSVPLWSSVSVGGVPLIPYLKQHNIDYSPDTLAELHRLVVDGAYEVIKLKGYTSWAIGYSVASLVKSLLRDQRRIHPVSVCARGFHGIEDEVYLSLPAEIGRAGVLGVMDSPLTDEEREQLHNSAKTLAEIQKKLDI
jgi:L-lactate dehydrogenase